MVFSLTNQLNSFWVIKLGSKLTGFVHAPNSGLSPRNRNLVCKLNKVIYVSTFGKLKQAQDLCLKGDINMYKILNRSR